MTQMLGVTPQMTRIPRVAPRLALAVIVAIFVVTGLQGIDFGAHWDEQSLANRVRWSLDHGGTLLPGTYDWPSVPYWLALASLAPDFRFPASFAPEDIHRLETHLVSRLDSPEYRLRLRRVFLIVASLALLWVYLGAAVWSGTEWAGVVAAGLLAGSWQFAYHARWPAPDAVLVQFVALIMLGAILTRSKPASRAGPAIAAVACGLALGTKYTAWPIVATWLASGALVRAARRERWRRPAAREAALVAAIFLATTPGALLQPIRFVGSLLYLRGHYSDEASVLAPYLVGAGWPMLSASFTYLGAALWSPWIATAAAISLVVIAGVRPVWRRDPSLVLLLAASPVLLAVGLAFQPVFLVRNLLPTAAPLAILGAAATSDAVTRFARWRPAIAGVAAIVIAAHLAFLMYAAGTISNRTLVADTFHANYAGRSCPSERLAQSLGTDGASDGARVCSGMPAAQLPGEIDLYPPPLFHRPRVIGPLDVDVLYYPTWIGSAHILIFE